jgi:hypothetical protein
MSQSKDLKFGLSAEKDVMPIINRYFNDQAVPYDDVYSTQDLHSCMNVYELKSRNIRHNEYKTAIIGCNKAVLQPQDIGKNLYFLFNYTDGLYYIKYDKEVFDTFNKRMFCRNARNDCLDKSSAVYDIPIDKLTKII